MKLFPTERAMGLVTVLSGLAVPVGVLMGAGPLGSTSEAVKAFEVGMWVVNPFGMAAFKIGVGLYGTIGLYILGTMFSALVWGMIDALLFGGKGEGESL